MFTPRRVLKGKTVYSDHFSVKIVLKNLPIGRISESKVSIWNLNKPKSWDRYKLLSNKAACKMMKIINNEELNINEVVEKMNNIDNKIRFKSFGKTKLIHNKSLYKCDSLSTDKDLMEKQNKRVENMIEDIDLNKEGKCTNIFKLKI